MQPQRCDSVSNGALLATDPFVQKEDRGRRWMSGPYPTSLSSPVFAMTLGTYIETEEDLQRALQFYKNVNFGFGKNYIKLDDAVQSLVDPESKPLVGMHHQFAPRWVVRWQCLHETSVAAHPHLMHSQLTHRGTRREVVLTSVGLWRWNSDLETGNFVPVGRTAPERLAEDRMCVADVPNAIVSY